MNSILKVLPSYFFEKKFMNNIEVIAEIANAHQGDPDIACNLALKAIDAGADAVKFQVYFAHELLIKRHPRYSHFSQQAFNAKVWEKILTSVKGKGVKIYCDVFGVEALAIALANGADGLKIHSSDLGNQELLGCIAKLDIARIILSTGGCTAREIAFSVNALSCRHRPVLMHGFQSYPTAVEDASLSRINWLQTTFGCRADIGYQDHVDGDDTFAVTLPLMALAMGATVIEKHVTLDRAAKGVDYYSSFEPHEFKNFISTLRLAQSALGSRPEQFSVAEQYYRKTAKKRIVAARPLELGRVLSSADLTVKRVPEDIFESANMDQLIGRTLIVPLNEEAVLSRAHVKTTSWALVVARSRSSRLPGKALIDAGGVPALQHLLERLKQSSVIDKIVVCTTTLEEDTPIAELALSCGVTTHRGPVDNVLERMMGAMEGHEVDVVIRVTGDDILVDPDYIERGLAYHLESNSEYSDLKALPSGTEVEFFDAQLLYQIFNLATDLQGTEYLTYYVTHHQSQFRTCTIPVDKRHAHNWRLTLDTAEDYQVISRLLCAMRDQGKGLTYRIDDIVHYFMAHPEELQANSLVRQRQKPIDVNTDLDWKRLVQS